MGLGVDERAKLVDLPARRRVREGKHPESAPESTGARSKDAPAVGAHLYQAPALDGEVEMGAVVVGALLTIVIAATQARARYIR